MGQTLSPEPAKMRPDSLAFILDRKIKLGNFLIGLLVHFQVQALAQPEHLNSTLALFGMFEPLQVIPECALGLDTEIFLSCRFGPHILSKLETQWHKNGAEPKNQGRN